MSDFKNRSKKYQRNNKPLQDNAKVYGIDEPLLNLLCSYVLSSNANIHKYAISSLYKFISSMSSDSFNDNPIMDLKYKFLMAALKLRTNGLTDKDLILSDINRKFDISGLINDNRFLKELSNAEVTYIENTIGTFLNNAFLSSNINSFMEICKGYQQASFREKELFLNQIRTSMTQTLTQFRRNDMNKDSASTLFRLSGMRDSIEDIHRYITAPSYRLVTGMQGLNGMLGGGFEKGRVYSFFGLAGEGKTVTLENMMYQIWKYNKGFKTKDPTKKPCIVYLTMENFVIEYICALYHILTRGKELKDCGSAEEAIEEFKNHKFEYSDDNDIEIVIKFKPVNSVDTSYMYQITEELEDEGFEVICFIQDYLMRIRPSIVTKDTYQDLGTIVNDFKTYATLKQVPVITASQLNRDAAKIIDEGRGSNQANLIKKLSRSNIGDSINIDRNLDGSIIIVPEVGADGKRYMAFKLTKHRYPIHTNKIAIYQPFYESSAIALVEDAYESKPAYRETLSRDPEEIRAAFGEVKRVGINDSIRSLAGLTESANKMMKPGFTDTPHKEEELMSLPVTNMVVKENPKEEENEFTSDEYDFIEPKPGQERFMHVVCFKKK